VLNVAEALLALFATDDRLAPPKPDIEKLKASSPISEMEDFLGWGD
jgi:hypothetical protein